VPSYATILRVAMYTAAAMFAVTYASRSVPAVRSIVKGA
jgi:hypothetical protein